MNPRVIDFREFEMIFFWNYPFNFFYIQNLIGSWHFIPLHGNNDPSMALNAYDIDFDHFQDIFFWSNRFYFRLGFNQELNNWKNSPSWVIFWNLVSRSEIYGPTNIAINAFDIGFCKFMRWFYPETTHSISFMYGLIERLDLWDMLL